MGCSVCGDTLQYMLEENVSHGRTRQVTHLFTYLLTHKLFSSYVRRYVVSRVCDWVMPALIISFITGPPTQCKGSIVLLVDVCRRLSSSVTIHGGTT